MRLLSLSLVLVIATQIGLLAAGPLHAEGVGRSAFDSNQAGARARAVVPGRPNEKNSPPPGAGAQNERLVRDGVSEEVRRWQKAQEKAAKEQWAEAVQWAEAALVVQQQQFPDQPREALRMLEAICLWQTKQRQFSSALIAARELVSRKNEILGPQHWESTNAKLNVAFVEQLGQLSAEEWQQFQQAEELSRQAVALQQSGNTRAALATAEHVLPIYTKLFGREHPLVLTSLCNAIVCHLELGQYFQARPHVQEAIELAPRLKGILHPDTVFAMRLLARFNESIGDLKNAEEGIRKALEIQTVLAGPNAPETLSVTVDLAKICTDGGKLAEAEKLLGDALRQQRELFGDEHAETAQTMKLLGTVYTKQRKFEQAERLLAQSVVTFQKSAGEKHLATASALNALGRLRTDMGQFQQAEVNLQASLAVCTARLGRDHPSTAKVLDSLARLYEATAQSAAARQLWLEGLRICEQAYGETNLLTADMQEIVARAYLVMNDFGLAEPYLLRARQTRHKLLGDKHPQTAAVVGQLAYVYLAVGQSERAEPLFHEAIAVLESASGEDTAILIRLRQRLALLYQSRGDFARAEAQYRSALRAAEERMEQDASIATIQIGLAQTLLCLGRCDEACQLVDAALRTYDRTLQLDHPQWIDALAIGGMAKLAGGDVRAAEQLLSRGLTVAYRATQADRSFPSERQRLSQIKMVRTILDLYLSLPHGAIAQIEVAYQHLLSWKGAVAAHQWHQRQQTRDEMLPLDRELQTLTQQLATKTLRVPPVPERNAWMREIFELNMRKESLEEKKALHTGSLMHAKQIGATVPELQRALPDGTVLLDFLSYSHFSGTDAQGGTQPSRQERCLAFVVRPRGEVALVELGDMQPITEAVIKWRQTRGFKPDQGKTDWAAALGELVWKPLRPHVQDCHTILIAPDGILAQLPWNALPGTKPGTYLIEEFAIATIPVPRLLPFLNDAGAAARREAPDSGESLLLVGNVDYGTAAQGETSEPPATATATFLFEPLPGTAAEVNALQSRFDEKFGPGKVLLLENTAATEGAFRHEAPRHRWIHIATHGFFAPPIVTAAIDAQKQMDPAMSVQGEVSVFHVGYLNGLALAGANSITSSDEDGILTAAELGTLDLRQVEVAVLSGCETGLGQVQGGEGSFGMQRALQIAGVRTTVGSLWTVSDRKTSLLMQRFYKNLWDNQLTKLEALREAQLWLLRTGGNPTPSAKRTSPHFWAAFTLSGEWR